MNAKPHTYIVRIWLEPDPEGPGLWRASVMDTSTRERQYFADPSQLARFCLEASPNWPLPLPTQEEQ